MLLQGLLDFFFGLFMKGLAVSSAGGGVVEALADAGTPSATRLMTSFRAGSHSLFHRDPLLLDMEISEAL